MPANIQFKRGLLSNLPQEVADGSIYITTDEHAMYMDYGTQRIRLGDFIPVNTIADLPISGHAYETAMYYVKQDNILARWNASANRWIQINKAGVVGVQSTGTGNLVSEITTTVAADGTLQLLVTKASVASSTDFETLAARLTAAENSITTITGDANTNGSMLNIAASVSNTLLGNEVTYINLKLIGDQLRALTTAVDTLNGDSTIAGSVDKKVADAIAAIVANAPSDFDTLKEISDWIANHPDDSAAINSAITSLQSRMTTVEGDIATEILNRTSADATLQDNIDAANTRIDTTNTTVSSLSTSLSNLTLMVENHENCLTWIDFDTTI